MAKVITEMNPKPMKLKFEKVFFQLVKKSLEKNTLETRKLSYEHFTPAFWTQNNLCETTLEHKSKRLILYTKTGFKRSFLRYLIYKNKSELKIYIDFYFWKMYFERHISFKIFIKMYN